MRIPRRPPRIAVLAAVAGWLCLVASFGVAAFFDYRLAQMGRSDLRQLDGASGLWLIPILSAAVVGSALMLRRPRHPAGWLFMALAISIDLSGTTEGYVNYGALARPGSLPFAGIAAVFSEGIFIPWLTILALILLVTPEGYSKSRTRRMAAGVTVVSGTVAGITYLLRPYRGVHESRGLIENPLAIDRLSGPFGMIDLALIVVLHAVLLGAAGAIVLRFWRARGNRRRQLRWVALAMVPFPVLVVGAFIAASVGNEALLAVMGGGFVAVVPIAAALAIEQDRLYEMDHLLSRGLTYGILTAAVVACYAIVVVFVGDSLGNFGGSSQVSAVVGTLAAVSLALPLRRWLQDSLDRRFNRRRFDAVATVRRFASDPSGDASIEDVLRTATGDPSLAVAFWIEDRSLWATATGEPATPAEPFVAVARKGAALARVSFRPDNVAEAVVRAACDAAQSELENARLRAAITLQLVEVRESRARIVEAQRAERQRIERNLHDGAQQRLLALALQLRAAEMSGSPDRAVASLGTAVDEIQAAVRDLRDLANGLHPTILADGGLPAALGVLASRATVEVCIDAAVGRFSPSTEEAAWFIACEAMTNAVKHASPTKVEIRACAEAGILRLLVSDDGVGGANPGGRGLRGIADRAEAAGGRLWVEARPGGGTVIGAELPCAS